MKTLDQLKDFYTNELRSELEAVEGKRRKVATTAILAVVGIVLLTLALAGAIIALGVLYGIAWSVLVLLLGTAFAWMGFQQIVDNRDFYTDFKTRVIERIVKYIDPSFTYISHKYIQPAQLVQSHLFTHKPKKYKGDDYAAGVLGKDLRIEFSEVHARYLVPPAAGKKAGKKLEDLFKGLFVAAHMPQPFQGQTYLLPTGMGPGDVNPVGGAQLQKVDTNYGEFDNKFSLFTTHPQEAKSLLPVDVMDHLLEFRKHRTEPLKFAFVGSSAYAAFWHKKDLFEPKIFQSLLDFSIIAEYYEDLYQSISMLETLERGGLSRTAQTTTVAG